MKKHGIFVIALAIVVFIALSPLAFAAEDWTKAWTKDETFRIDIPNGRGYLICIISVFSDGAVAVNAYDYGGWHAKSISQFVLIQENRVTIERHRTDWREGLTIVHQQGSGYDIFGEKFLSHAPKLPLEVQAKLKAKWKI